MWRQGFNLLRFGKFETCHHIVSRDGKETVISGGCKNIIASKILFLHNQEEVNQSFR
jgi:hypothetical protein